MTRPEAAEILLVEDNPGLAALYAGYLAKADLTAHLVGTGTEAIACLDRDAAGPGALRLVLLDLVLPDIEGFAVLRHSRRVASAPAVVVITAHGSIDRAVAAMQLGARDFLVKPCDESRLVTTTRNALEHTRLQQTVAIIRDDIGRTRFHGFIGGSLAMQAVYRMIECVARSRAAVFITGESGTGKEVCAEAIHRAGPRRAKPFVPLNCSAIPRDLIESEMFGHLKGAFTGASADRPGAARLADGGTLFLDEICEMAIGLQAKLLRFLQTGQIQRVGSSRLEPVDVRILCATNRDPWTEVVEGRFREDLYYRLHVIPVPLPPLRERGDDVLEIAREFLLRFSEEEGKRFRRFSPEAEEALLAHAWPGNVRELQNVIRNVVVLQDGQEVTRAMLPAGVAGAVQAAPVDPEPSAARVSEAAGWSIAIGRPLREIERDAIEATIALCDGSIPKAAKMLAVSPSTLYRKRESWQAEGLLVETAAQTAVGRG